MMKVTIQISSLILILFSWSATAWAQPVNDNCSNALNVEFSASQQTVVLTNGDSRGATASTSPASVCSTSFYTDDTWYKFTTPAIIPVGSVVIHVYFGENSSTDVTAVGIALYASCGTSEAPLVCLNSYDPADNQIESSSMCLLANHTYYLRVWSVGADQTTEGTFRVGVYPIPNKPEHILWVDRFDSDPFLRGWTTYGVCGLVADSSVNAVWDYLPNGSIQASAFTTATTVSSESYCDGAIGVNSDFNDNGGTGVAASGSVPTSTDPNGATDVPATYVMESPAIYMGDWNVAGISVEFYQAVRELRCSFTLSYRNKNTGDPNWGDWTDIEINQDLVANASTTFNKIRLFLNGANSTDSIQFKLTYLAHYYFWIVDDFKIVETECTNTRVQSNFYAIAPFAQIPSDQVYPFGALSDIFNAGACPQSNVVLNHTVQNTGTGTIIYNQNLNYGTVEPASLEENRLFPTLINLPKTDATYRGTYTLTQDSIDFDPLDNSISFQYSVGGNVFALEDGPTRSIAVNPSIYNDGAPLSYAYGNYFRPVKDVEVDSITWGVSNSDSMINKTVTIYLLQWTDTNGDHISENGERKYIALKDYTFTGTEGNDVLINTQLDNFENPGDPIIMKGGFGYIVLVEYQAASSDDPTFFMLASDARDYSAQQLALDSAYAKGLSDFPMYFSVLGWSADGLLANIDYEVTTMALPRRFFGNDIVPVVRVIVKNATNTKDELPDNNQIAVYPNPVSDEIHVKMEFTRPYRDIQMRLINNIGQTVFSKTLNSTITSHIEPINVSSFASGNYMLQVETPDGQRIVPVIVIH